MLVRQEVTLQATHGRSLPSPAAWEEGSIRPQGQLAGVERGEERRDVGKKKGEESEGKKEKEGQGEGREGEDRKHGK